MDGDIKWLIGIAISAMIAQLTALVGAFWRLLIMIKSAETQAKTGDDLLHDRINRMRDDTVHKSDLSDLSARLTKDLHEIRDEQRTANNNTNLRLDALLNAIANRNNGSGQ